MYLSNTRKGTTVIGERGRFCVRGAPGQLLGWAPTLAGGLLMTRDDRDGRHGAAGGGGHRLSGGARGTHPRAGPLDWAATQNNLGLALWTLGERESGTARLEEAVAAYRAALEERTRERVPLDWAATQNNLGTALCDARRAGERHGAAGGGGRPPIGRRCEERTRERVPLDWATTQNNLGTALWTLGRAGERHGAAGGGGRRLPRGAGGMHPRAGAARLGRDAEQSRHTRSGPRASARAARRGWRRRSPPIGRRWRNGPASGCRSTGPRRRTTSASRSGRSGERESGTARLEEAVAAYRAALEERTRERVPLDWAATQNNLGNALRTLGERESGTARLEEAVAAFRAALQEYTRARVPLDWAATQNNLGNRALGARARGRAARRGWRRRSPPIGRRSRNGPASGCRSTGP